jgi:hypothetical protein
MLPLTNILLAVLIIAVLCIPGVFDRFITVLFIPVLIAGLGGLIGFVGAVGLYIASVVKAELGVVWASRFFDPLVAELPPSYSQWLYNIFGGTPSLLDMVYVIGLTSLAAMLLCVSYVKLFPWIRYYYVRIIMRQLA